MQSQNSRLLQHSNLNISYNKATLEAYNQDIAGYIRNTPGSFGEEHHPLVLWIQKALSYLPRGGRVLELGSGTGRDALFMESLGYKVIRSDGAIGFVNHLRKQGFDALKIDVLSDPLPASDMIFANAVISHFNRNDTIFVMSKIFNSIKQQGIVAINAKQGIGEAWINEKLKRKRYVYFWDPGQLRFMVKELGFEILYCTEDLKGDLKSHTWTHLILRKPSSK